MFLFMYIMVFVMSSVFDGLCKNVVLINEMYDVMSRAGGDKSSYLNSSFYGG